MIIRNIIMAITAMSVMACTKPQIETGTRSIIPLPVKMDTGEGVFEWDQSIQIGIENEAQEKIASLLAQSFESASGWKPTIVRGSAKVEFVTEEGFENEGYALEVSESKIRLIASERAGFFYAMISLKQLFPASFYAKQRIEDVVWALPSVKIEDAPRFGWRGYMLDVSRHFFNVEEVKEVLDFMADSKLNRFHWHLTDDQGWRLEIKQYPKLTEIGAWRVDHNITDETVSNWWGRPAQKDGEKATYGGFYTQEEVKDIIAYAKERNIEVIPEIDMPGHAQATVAAYPEIGCVNAAPYVATGGVYKNNTYNPGKEITFEFAENVLNEVMDLFPFDYVHIGGDECNKDQWKIDPDAQRRIKEEGLKDEHELQSYFIRRIEQMINARGKNMIGWDEILEGGLAPNATVMSWRGEKGGLLSVQMGHDVIMTPNKYCYIDLKQGHDDLEPNLGYSELLLSTSYSYQVVPESLNEEEGKLIKGIQANMWTESISDWGKLTYMNFPRIYAIAETGWTVHKAKNWKDFTTRLESYLDRLEAQGVRFAWSAFSPWIEHKAKDGQIEITMHTEVDDLDIHYTLDGTTPTLKSPLYKEPFLIDNTSMISSQAFKSGEQIGTESQLEFSIHKAVNAAKSSGIEKLTDLNYARLSNADRNWSKMGDQMNTVLEFTEETEVSRVAFDALRFTIAGVYPPSEVKVYGSTDGKNYDLLASLDQTETSLVQGRNKIKSVLEFEPVKVKQLRIEAKAVSPLPEGHHKAGNKAIMKIDEIVVN